MKPASKWTTNLSQSADKPVVLLNTAGFYDGLALQLRRMEQKGFYLCR